MLALKKGEKGRAIRDVLAAKRSWKIQGVWPNSLGFLVPMYRFLIKNACCGKILTCKEGQFQACFKGPTGDFPCVPVGQHARGSNSISNTIFSKIREHCIDSLMK